MNAKIKKTVRYKQRGPNKRIEEKEKERKKERE
jgi:hypothetical protein